MSYGACFQFILNFTSAFPHFCFQSMVTGQGVCGWCLNCPKWGPINYKCGVGQSAVTKFQIHFALQPRAVLPVCLGSTELWWGAWHLFSAQGTAAMGWPADELLTTHWLFKRAKRLPCLVSTKLNLTKRKISWVQLRFFEIWWSNEVQPHPLKQELGILYLGRLP